MRTRTAHVALRALGLALAVTLLTGCGLVVLPRGGSDDTGGPVGGSSSGGPHGGVERVVLAQGYGTGFGGSITVEWRPAVLYGDGTYTTDTGSALSSAPVVEGRWSGGAGAGWRLEPDDGGEPVDVPPALAARPAEGGLTLDGSYRATGGVGAPGAGVPVVAAWDEVEFSPDGRLVAANGGGADAGGVAAGGSTTVTGRYRLDGWTATVEYPDGRTETVLFYLFPDSDDAVGFAGLTLSRRR
jgi:hypothetical protein